MLAPMIERVVEPEILDGLDPGDPAAVASRRDLRRINRAMGNERWILRQVRRQPERARRGMVELGAGDGWLANRLCGFGDTLGVDLAPRPGGARPELRWHQGDLFEAGPLEGGILVASLFLHHFEAGRLAAIGRLAEGFGMLLFTEPLRTRGSLRLGKLVLPFVSRVTKHDMPVSIRAGFVPGELAELMGLSAGRWRVSERSTWRGGLRMLACRT